MTMDIFNQLAPHQIGVLVLSAIIFVAIVTTPMFKIWISSAKHAMMSLFNAGKRERVKG